MGSKVKKVVKPAMPECVKRVHEAMVKNASTIGCGDDVYTGVQQFHHDGPYDEWAIGDNLERLDGCIVYNVKKDQWFYREKWSGEDTLMKGGEQEAIANAEIFYTG